VAVGVQIETDREFFESQNKKPASLEELVTVPNVTAI
jgi:hypothetical protein